MCKNIMVSNNTTLHEASVFLSTLCSIRLVVLIERSACRQLTCWSGLPCHVARGQCDGGCFAGGAVEQQMNGCLSKRI
jgi:hypothetical protein